MRKFAWLLVGLVLAATGCAGPSADTVYVVPYATTTLYGKAPAPTAIATGPDGQVTCAADAVSIVVQRDATIEDSGQTIRTFDWPEPGQKGGQIILGLERIDGTSVWSYEAILGELDGKSVGKPGGLLPLGVVTEKLVIQITVGDDVLVPDTVTLCRRALG